MAAEYRFADPENHAASLFGFVRKEAGGKGYACRSGMRYHPGILPRYGHDLYWAGLAASAFS